MTVLQYTPFSEASERMNAKDGAVYVFSFLKKELQDEIYILYLNRCQKDFSEKYAFENEEPFIKGFMEARYFILRKFNIRFEDFFSFPLVGEHEQCGNEIKYA